MAGAAVIMLIALLVVGAIVYKGAGIGQQGPGEQDHTLLFVIVMIASALLVLGGVAFDPSEVTY